MASKSFRKNGDKRDGKQFVLLPRVVLDSPGYRRVSHTGRSLLIDLASQYNGYNNGKLVACAKYLEPMGWRSNDTVLRAVHDLVDCGLLIETRKGKRPNTAAWYALSWLDLDHTLGLDIDPKLYQRCHRGTYMTPEKQAPVDAGARTRKATESRKVVATEKRVAKQNASLTPSHGAPATPIAPSDGVRPLILVPSHGAIQGAFGQLTTPLDGAYLEIPSTPAWRGSVDPERCSGRSVSSGT